MVSEKRILIVDDTKSIHDDFCHTLSQSASTLSAEALALEKDLFNTSDMSEQYTDIHYTIDSAYQGLEAVEMVSKAHIEHRPYNLIYMDVRMPPGIDGIETIYRIWQQYPEIEIVICSAYSDYTWNDIKAKLKSTDKLIFLKKPFNKDNIIQTTYLLSKKWDASQEKNTEIETLQNEVSIRTQQITDIKNQLDSIQKQYEQTALTKNNLLSHINQEIKSPLNGIITVTDLLLDTSLDSEQADLAQSIKQSGHSLNEIITNLLEVEILAPSTHNNEKVEFNIRSLIENIIELIQIKIDESGVFITTSLQSSLPDTCKGDPLKIKQLLVQLVLDSVSRTPKGRIDISVNLERKESDSIFLINFIITDSGIPFSNDELTVLTTTLSTPIPQTTERLGLFKKILDSLDGTTTLRNQKMNGAYYSFTIPVESFESDQVIIHNKHYGDSIQNLRCLIIGDNPSNRKILSLHINHWGSKSTEVSSIVAGVEKFSLLQNTLDSFAMVILDFKGSNIEPYINFAHKIKDMRKTTPYTLIGIVPQGHKGDLSLFKEAGFSAYLSKPLKQQQLYNCLLLLKQNLYNQLPLPQIITKYILDEYSMERFSVLIIESDIVSQKLLVYLFRELKLICDFAFSTNEAIEAISQKKYDIIICARITPSIDGPHICAETDTIRKKNGTRFIGVTSNNKSNWNEQLFSNQLDDVIHKPFDKKAILEQVKTLLKPK